MEAKTYTDAVSELNEELRRQREINAELLEAIETLVKLHHDWDKGTAYVQVSFYEKNKKAIANARAAIAKAAGGAK